VLVMLPRQMKRWSRMIRSLFALAAGLAFLFVASVLVVRCFNPFHAHEHCSKATGLAFGEYSNAHEGKYPFHTNGFGDALLLLLKEGYATPNLLTAPGDDGKMFKEYLEKGLDVPEEKCTRIYIQGLSDPKEGDVSVMMMFDKYPTRGGDHFRSPWGRPTRDVIMNDGSVEFVSEERWPAFAKEQIELLVKLGFKRPELEKLVGLPVESIR